MDVERAEREMSWGRRGRTDDNKRGWIDDVWIPKVYG